MNNASSRWLHLNLPYLQVLIARFEIFDDLIQFVNLISGLIINGVSLEV